MGILSVATSLFALGSVANAASLADRTRSNGTQRVLATSESAMDDDLRLLLC